MATQVLGSVWPEIVLNRAGMVCNLYQYQMLSILVG